MNHSEKARQLFLEGYNCSQAVLCAFDDVTGLDRETSAKLASSFGGGMGRMREVCGCVSGALMVLGLVHGYDDPENHEAKKEHYALVQRFAARFREQNGSIICRELLAGVTTTPGGEPEARTDAYYKKRPCPDLVACAANLLEDFV
ncbi:MAG: C_GCAxxG_C_C family protein [Eubacterium sp.]|nr:C_GCAxxG_C_C family protein [Eubacterium sp.]